MLFAGDTGPHAHWAEIRRRYRPTTALLPCDGTSVRWEPRQIMNPHEAAAAAIALGCAEADVFRAIAAMSGSLNGGTCSGTQQIAYWGSHGTNDPTINISNGRMVRDTFRMRNHCTSTTVDCR